MQKFNTFLCGAALLWAGAACDDSSGEQPVEPPFIEPEAEQIVFTQSNLVYYGDPDGLDSDEWRLTLMTDRVTVDEAGNPVGPGSFMQLSLNAVQGDEADLRNLAGVYVAPMSTSDFSPGTYNPGMMSQVDLPTGVVEMPTFSFYGELAEGSTDFEPDLLRDKGFSVAANDDGTYTVAGSITGTMFLQRHFSYTGGLKIVDRTEPKVPNTTLTADVTLASLVQARICDRGDWFFTGDESYRLFEVTLAAEGIAMNKTFPDGEGDVLRLELLVEWAADAADGIPAGTYRMISRSEDGSGINRKDIRPGCVVAGKRNVFTTPAGTWYQHFAAGTLDAYACIEAGEVTVERPDGGHRLTVALRDENGRKVECVFATPDPIAIYK